MISKTFVCFTLVAAFTTQLDARFVPVLSYEELFKQSEFVFIVRAISTRDWKKGDPKALLPDGVNLNVTVVDINDKDREIKTNRDDYLKPVVTEFHLLSVLKGKCKRKKVLVPHYRFEWPELNKNLIQLVHNGPQLIQFDLKAKAQGDLWDGISLFVPGNGDCLLFLNQECDGDFTFVTGQFDPVYSVFALTPGDSMKAKSDEHSSDTIPSKEAH